MNGSKKLNGRVIVVTGGGRGIGKATALASANEGGKVAVCDLQDAQGKETVDEIRRSGGNATYYHLDVSKEDEVRKVFAQIAEELGPIYGLVNNAGITGPAKPTHEVEERDLDNVFAVNIKGVFFCTKYAIPYMTQQGRGSVVNISSVYGIVGAVDVLPSYPASKGAVRSMTKTDALFYAKNGVRVNSVHPGFIDTPMVQNFVREHATSMGGEAAVYGQLEALHPMGRIGRAEEVAAGIVFLLSDDSSFMTGSELVIDGGYTCR